MDHHSARPPGLELVTQEYLAARRELRSRTDLAPAQREWLEDEIANEHGLRCAQEWKSLRAQMRDDQEAESRSFSESVPLSRRARKRLPSPVGPEDDKADERARREIRHEQAWERYLEAEQRDLEMRQEGHLARMLGDPLPEESPEDLNHLAQGDRLKALEGLVALKSESGESVYKPLSELTPEDRRMRMRAEGERVDWIVGRRKKWPSSSP